MTRSMSSADMPFSTILCLSAARCSLSRALRQFLAVLATMPPRAEAMATTARKCHRSKCLMNSATACLRLESGCGREQTEIAFPPGYAHPVEVFAQGYGVFARRAQKVAD